MPFIQLGKFPTLTPTIPTIENFYLQLNLNFVENLYFIFDLIWFFLLYSINIIDYNVWFSNVELALHLCNKLYLVIWLLFFLDTGELDFLICCGFSHLCSLEILVCNFVLWFPYLISLLGYCWANNMSWDVLHPFFYFLEM